MTILSDRQITALCTPPTHSALFGNWDTRLVYADGNEMVESGTGDRRLCSEIPMDLVHPIPKPVGWLPMIEPFVADQVRERAHRITADEGYTEKIISYGLSSFGYDLRLGHTFRVFTNVNSTIVDPKNFDNKAFVDVEVKEEGGEIIIPPNSFILGYSVEKIRMPRNVVGVVVGKSTIARMGINCLCTPLEPGWEGHVTLEFANGTPLPAKLYVGEGCCQVMFHRGETCKTTYADRGGKYQGQEARPITPKV